jgi:signal peptidase II
VALEICADSREATRMLRAGSLSEDTTPSRASGGAWKLPWLALAAAVLAADLWTKHVVFYPAVLEPWAEGRVVGTVTSWWKHRIAYNTGITFGKGATLPIWVLALGVGIVIAMLLRSLWKTPGQERVKCFALSVIVGGALGNLYDRALRPFVERDETPGVRDFIDWYIPSDSALGRLLASHGVAEYHWYTFNVADAFIVSGVILLAWKVIREKPAEAPAAAAQVSA